MKTKLYLIAILAMMAFSCSDDEKSVYSCSSCVDEPEALLANNELAKGVYKGVIVGSSGTFKIHFANGDANITATLILDGVEYHLIPSYEYVEGGFEGNFVDDRDTETQADDIVIGFAVNSDGTAASVYSVTIPGHPNAAIKIFKEFSDALVMGFEGSYSGTKAGTFNMVVRIDEFGDGAWHSVSRESVDNAEANFVEGEISENEVTASGDVTVDGAIVGDKVSGTWSTPIPEAGTFSGRRTL